jgi:hypothetical protein
MSRVRAIEVASEEAVRMGINRIYVRETGGPKKIPPM